MQRAGIRILDLKCYNADMRLQQIKIYPKRYQKFANRITPGSDFLTPVQLHYYCNPLKGSELSLSCIFQGKQPINGKITVQSEKSRKEYVQTIQSHKSFRVSLMDDSIHHILIEIPEVSSPREMR